MNRYVVVLASFALGCNGEDGGKDTAGGDEIDAILALTPDTTNGAAVFDQNCALCHGDDGAGSETGGGSDIRGETDEREVVEIILDGNDEGMTPFRGFLSEQEIADVTAFVTTGGLL